MRIFWYCPLKIFDAFEEMSDNPSFRLRCLNTHKYLLKNNYFSKIVHNTEDIINPDIIVFMSFGEEELELAKWAKKRNVKLVHDYSENIRGIPVLEETKELCDFIVCCSTALGRLEKINYPSKAVVVEDPIESSPVIHNPDHSRNTLKVVWTGMGGNAGWVSDLLKPIVESLDMEYVEISNRVEADVLWNRDTWKYEMALCDISLCPQIHWQFPAKSNVKVTTSIGLGLPVIASPIESYTEIIRSGFNGFICHKLEDWKTSLLKLKSKDIRKLFIKRTQDIIPYYSEVFIYRQWEAVFRECLGSKL